ncbi:cyclic nucleotide-binding domain-containing protein [Aurantiacibacter sp. D1-12]|uniref:cyclic nucleotide-binding domain-containing protein n=1 Tax=Aurantiacibacter sp. D1-12 TaxID=2993658 RepID=UPI00237C9C43|nr:cyclic nucleotide-binding domain-containing protein [Aurantiacibacter sp. D1-12]MDE1466481.1 cyclic nucleotide-binding domain-containing protein [Aurantiacibacter sp. D1-12]
MASFLEFIADGENLFLTMAALVLALALLMGTLRDLRILVLVAGLFAIAHYTLRQADSVALIWVILLTLANAIPLVLLLMRSRRGLMRNEERELLEEVLKVEDPSHQRRLLDLVEWRDVREGETLVRQGQARPPLVYIASGEAAVEFDGAQVGVAEAGDFLGEMSLVSGATASASVVSLTAMRVARIERDGVIRLSGAIPELSGAFDRAMNLGMAAKIARMNEAVAEGEK